MNLHLGLHEEHLNFRRLRVSVGGSLPELWVSVLDPGGLFMWQAMLNLCPALLKSWWWSCNLKVPNTPYSLDHNYTSNQNKFTTFFNIPSIPDLAFLQLSSNSVTMFGHIWSFKWYFKSFRECFQYNHIWGKMLGQKSGRWMRHSYNKIIAYSHPFQQLHQKWMSAKIFIFWAEPIL